MWIEIVQWMLVVAGLVLIPSSPQIYHDYKDDKNAEADAKKALADTGSEQAQTEHTEAKKRLFRTVAIGASVLLVILFAGLFILKKFSKKTKK